MWFGGLTGKRRRRDDGTPPPSPPRDRVSQGLLCGLATQMSDQAKKAAWIQAHQKTWGGFTGLPNRMVDHPAYAALSSAAAVRCVTWFWQEARYERVKKKPGQDSPIGRIDKIINNGQISFTYQQARWRGMSSPRFARVLKELHRLGFIDVRPEDLGRGVKGKFTRYFISARWQKYGTLQFEEIPFPENFKEGFRSDEFKEKRRKRKKKNNVHERALPAYTDIRYEGAKLHNNVHERALKTAPGANSKRTPTYASKDISHTYTTPERIKKKDVALGEVDRAHGRGDTTTSPPPKQWRPPKHEIRENIVEILSRRPDKRARNRRFVSSLLDQLQGVQHGRLDASRVHRDLQDQHGLDDWTADLLFTIAMIEMPSRTEVIH